jgi:hypothetical protein
MPADCGLVGRILLRRRAPVPLMEALTTRTQSADSVTIGAPMEIDSRCPKGGQSRPCRDDRFWRKADIGEGIHIQTDGDFRFISP